MSVDTMTGILTVQYNVQSFKPKYIESSKMASGKQLYEKHIGRPINEPGMKTENVSICDINFLSKYEINFRNADQPAPGMKTVAIGCV